MKTFPATKQLTKALLVITSVITLAGSVTYAALQSQSAILTGNEIETAVANLQISPDGTAYSKSEQGFDFANLIPCGQAMPTDGYTFFLKNAGGTALALKLAVSSNPSDPDGVDLSKVNVILTPVSSGQPQTFTLAALIASATNGGLALTSPAVLMNGAQQQFKLQVSMATDAVTGPSASINNLDFSFGGTAVN